MSQFKRVFLEFPTTIIDDNLFWGNDQIEHIELLLAGRDPLDKKKLKKIIERPRGIDRKAFKNNHKELKEI